MPDPIQFTEAQRAEIKVMRARGLSWDQVAGALGVSRSQAIVEGVGLGLAHSSTARVAALQERRARGEFLPREVRGILGGESLPAWHPISRSVLAEAGLPVPRVGEVW